MLLVVDIEEILSKNFSNEEVSHNKASVIGDQTIYVESGKLTMRNACIMKNDGKQVFYQSSSNSITLIGCSVDDNIDSYNKRPNIENIGTRSFINKLKFISTGYCNVAEKPRHSLINFF